MFGSCESIFGTEVPRRKNESKVSDTELQMMEIEITTDLAQAEVDNAKISSTTMQLDQLLNMYNHVKRFGIDRTFLSLYNTNDQLSNMIGVRFPSCESVDSEGYPGSSMSKAFLVAMEDSKEGIFAKIWEFIKKIIKKIVDFFKNVWTKVKEWFNLRFNKAKKQVELIKKTVAPDSVTIKAFNFVNRYPEVLTAAAWTTIALISHLKKIPKYKNSAHEKAINKDINDCNALIDKVLKSKAERNESLKKTTVYGRQFKERADKCLKELENIKDVSEKLDKMKDLINDADKFMLNHKIRPGEIQDIDDVKKNIKLFDKTMNHSIDQWKIHAEDRSALLTPKIMMSQGMDEDSANRLYEKAATHIGKSVTVLTKEIQERCKIYTTELDEMYEIVKTRNKLAAEIGGIHERSSTAESTTSADIHKLTDQHTVN